MDSKKEPKLLWHNDGFEWMCETCGGTSLRSMAHMFDFIPSNHKPSCPFYKPKKSDNKKKKKI